MARPGDAEIWDALLGHLSEVQLDRQLETAWPGVRFAPQRDSSGQLIPYLRVAIMPSESPRSLLQISVVWHDDDGTIAPCRVADRIAEHFALGTVIVTSAGQRVRVSRDPWVSPPLVDDGEVVVPLRVQWTPYTP